MNNHGIAVEATTAGVCEFYRAPGTRFLLKPGTPLGRWMRRLEPAEEEELLLELGLRERKPVVPEPHPFDYERLFF